MANKQFNSVDGYSVGNANIVIDSNGNVSGNVITATANVTAPQLVSNVATGTAPFVVSSTTLVANLNADQLEGYSPTTANTASTIALRDTNGNLSANFFIGNGSQLTGISTSFPIANGNSNIDIPAANGNINLSVAGNANVLVVTGTGIVTGSGSGGNISGANVISANTAILTTGNITTINSGLLQNGNSNITITANGNITLSATGTPAEITITSTGINVAGTLGVSGNANVGNIGGATGIFTTAANTPLVQNGTSNVTIASGGNISMFVAGNATARAIFTSTGANIAGTANITGNANVGNLGTAQVLASANVTAPQLISNVATGTAPIVVSSTTRVANLNVEYANVADGINVTAPGTGTGYIVFANATTGNVAEWTSAGITSNLANNSITATTFVGALSGAATSATTAGTVTTAAQPNITSVGTLTSLGVSGTVTAPAFTANTGVFTGNGSGLSAIAGANVTGTVSAATTAGTVTTAAQPNITSVGTLSSLAVTANANVGNLNAATRIYGNDNIIIGSTGSEGGQLILAYTGVNGITGQANSTWNMDVDSSNNFRLFSQNATGVVSAITMAAYSANNNVAFAGNVSAPFFIGNGSQLTGITVAAGSTIVNGTSNVVVDSSGNVRTSVAGTANVMVVSSTTVTAPIFAATDNGNGTNFRVGDDAWLGDVNEADTVRLMGQQNAANGYLVFGNADNSAKLGRAGTGPLTYAGGFTAANTIVSNAANGTAFLAAGNAFNNVALGISTTAGTGANMAIRDLSTVSSVMYFDVSVGNTPNGSFQFRTTNSFTLLANISNAGLNLNTGVFTGNGNGLSSLQGANVTGTVSAATTAGTVTTAAQPNITSVSTSFSGLTFVANAQLSMSGAGSQIDGVNLVSANFFSGNGSSITALNATNIASGTLAQARLANASVTLGSTALTLGSTVTTVAGLSSVTSTTFVGSLSGAATTAGTVTTAAQPNITSVGTLTGLTVGNATANAVFGNGTITLNSGLITGNGNGLSSLQAANVTGTLLTSVTNAISNVGTITAGTWNSTFTPGLNANTLANIQGANVTGTVPSATAATNASALLQNTSTATTVYPTFTTSSANGNSSAVINTGISANLGNSSITATTFVGALSGNATTAGTVVTAAQPNITSVGTLTSLGVTGNVTAANFIGNLANGNSDVNIPAANGNINFDVAGNANVLVVTGTGVNVAGTLNTGSGVITGNGSGLSAIAGANVTGTVSSATTAGTVTTAAQPNITSVGTLTSATVTGNVAAGNLTTTGVLSVTGTGVSSIAGNLDMTSNTIINLATPTNATDAATKQYVDDVAQGLNIHDAVQAATPTTLATITGGTITYNNGSSGVGANLTTTGSFNLIDGVNVQTAGTRILVKNEANAVFNGIYTWSNATVITRATDYNSVPEVEAGDFVFCTGGTLYDNTGWVQTDSPAAIGGATDTINFTQFSGAGTYQAGTGLTLTGSTFSVNASQTQITTVGTLGSLAVTGNANVGNLNATTAVVASTLTSNVATGTAPLVVTSTTRVSNLNVAYANVADNINVAAGTGNNFIIFANAATGNVVELTSTGLTANLSNNSITATTFVGALSGAATTAGTVTTAAQPNITSVGTLTGLTVGNATSNAVFGNGTITLNSGLITGNGNGLSSLQAANVTGTLPTSVTNAISNVGTITAGTWNSTFTAGLNANTLANIQGGNVSGTVASATAATNASALLQNTSTATTVYPTFSTSSANGNSSAVINTGISANLGNASITATTFVGALSGAATSATTAGTVTTAAQPNITSVGTLTSLDVNGTITGTRLISNIATGTAPLTVTSNTVVTNLNADLLDGYNTATANTANTVAVRDASGNLAANFFIGNGSQLTGVSATSTFNIANGTSNVSIPVASGNINFSVAGNANMLVVTGSNVQMGSGSGGTISGANLISANYFTAAGNITAPQLISNVATGTAPFVVSSTTLVANLNADALEGYSPASANTANTIALRDASGNLSANFFIGNGSQLTGLSTASISNGNSNVNIPAANGNVNISAVGNANVLVVTGTGANIAGTANVSGNANVGNIGAATAILTTAANVPLVQNGNANITITANANVTITAKGTARITATDVGANVTGTLGVSGILTGSANISGANIISTAYSIVSVGTGISAAGYSQGTGTALTKEFNVVSTVASGAGVVLPTAVAGMRITVLNTSANALLVYPASSGIINSAAANAAYSQPAGARLDYISTTTTQWYTLNATYG